MPAARTFLTATLAAMGLTLSGAQVQAGAIAPAFSAQDQHGTVINLSDFKDKSTVVLYFYPKDDTPGCTKEACSLRDGFQPIREAGAIVLGVSADDVASHAAFAEKYHLPFSLLADPGHTIIDAYGVRMPVLGMAKRITFIIGKDGIVRDVIQEVKAAQHDAQVLEALKR
jgi:peroxiredoxin Q/BCP